jgi:hypothetical protein
MGETRHEQKSFVREALGKCLLGKPRRRWENSVLT